MYIDLLIPFGYSNETDEIIEPHEAESGRACDAYCPGCKTPLVSRHYKNQDKRAHFAHDSKHPKTSKEKIKHCPFNGPFSIAYMARKLSAELTGEYFKTADLKCYTSCQRCHTIIFEGNVIRKDAIKITGVSSSYVYLNQTFDLMININDSNILIWLEYPDRPFPNIRFTALERTGVLKIDVNSFDTFKFKSNKRTFKDSVKDFLLSEGKREWIHHPTAEKRALTKSQNEPHTCVAYECMRCESQWFHNTKKIPNCPKNCHQRYCKRSTKQPMYKNKRTRISWCKT